MQNTLDKLLEQMGIGGRHQHDALLVLENHKTGKKRFIWGKNLVTDAGDVWYAEQACIGVAGSGDPTDVFANLYLATGGPETPGKTDNYGEFTGVTGEKAKTATYPKVSDDDEDNTGSGVDIVSWKFEYTTGDGPFVDVTHSFIAKVGATGTDPILNSYKWAAAWSKDGSTSAKVFANHEMSGS